MPKFWELLSARGKVNWAGMEACYGKEEVIGIYEQFMGKKWVSPKKDKRTINVEPKIEDLQEIDKLMRQKPSGRMGRA